MFRILVEYLLPGNEWVLVLLVNQTQERGPGMGWTRYIPAHDGNQTRS